MAIEQLTKPILNPIAAFDALLEHTFVFTAIGGAQVRGNRLVISENQTGNQVYNELQVTNGLYHILSANTLQNGGYYNAVIYTLDNANNESEQSVAVPFYCYSTPHLSFTNIPSSGTIENGTYEFQGTYSQAENEALNSYQFTLYDSNKDILSQTDLIYYQSDSSLSHTFVGMSNDTSYFIQLTGETVNNTKVDSGLISFTVRYLQPASFSICDLVNDCENGYIQISSNIVAIDGKSNPEPPKYIDDKEVDLRDKGDWVRWDEGFDIKNDFTMRAWGRDFNPYEKIITLANRNDTDDNYNKIEMKWMIGEIEKILPQYQESSGYLNYLTNSQEEEIRNLSIGGNSIQYNKQGAALGEGDYVRLNNLPEEYQEVEYLESTRTQYIDTGRPPQNKDRVVMKVLGTKEKVSDLLYGAWLNTTNSRWNIWFNGSDKRTNLGFGSNLDLCSIPLAYGQILNIDAYMENGSQYLIINNKSAYYNDSSFVYQNSLNATLFGRNTNNVGVQGCEARIYYCQIYNNGNILRDYVPCYRKSDNKPGMYDLVNNVFYVNSGTGEFLIGKEIPRVNYNEKIDEVLEGNTKQETREGYNKIYLNGSDLSSDTFTVKNNGDQTITINGTVAQGTKYPLSTDFLNLDKNKRYIVSIKHISGTVKLNTFFIYLLGLGDQNITQLNFRSDDNTPTFTVSSDFTQVPYLWFGWTSDAQGFAIFNNYTIAIQINEGTVAKPYQQYGLMPSLDFPSEVQGVRGYNILKIKDMEETDYNGLKVSIKDNVITLNGTSTKNINISNLLEEDMELDVGDYYLMYKTENPASVNSGGLYLSDANNADIINSLFWNNANKIVSIKEKTVVNINKTHIYLNANFVYNNTKQTIMLVRVYSNLEYLPYNVVKFENQGANFYNINDKYIGFWSDELIIDKDGWITADVDNSTGTTNKFLNFFTNISNFLITNKKYWFVVEIKDVSGQGLEVRICDNFNNFSQFVGYWNFDSFQQKAGDILINSRNTISDFSTCKSMLRSYIRASAGYKGSITFRLSVLSEEPNMYFSENHFDISNMEGGALSGTTGLPFNSDVANQRIRTKEYIPLKAGTWKLTFSGLTQNVVYRFDSNHTLYTEDVSQAWNVSQSRIITLKEDGYITCAFRNNASTDITVSDLKNPVLVERKTSFDYKPFVNQSFPVSLGNETLYGDDNARDYFDIEIDNKVWQQTGYKKITNAYLVKNWAKYELTSSDIFVQGNPATRYYLDKTLGNKDYFAKSNYFQTGNDNDFSTNNTIVLQTNRINVMSSDYTLSQLNAKLQELNVAGHPMYVIYRLEIPTKTIITDATQLSQLEALINMKTYEEQNNIVGFGDLPPYIKLSTITTPSLKYSSKVYSVGEMRNLIDIPDFNITYSQKYSEDTNTRFLLKPGYIYTLSFNFNTIESSTDIYYSIGYGINGYENDIQKQIQYSSVTTAKNSITFIVPENIPELATLWVKFAETLILADVNVDIQNIQLNKGKEVLSYQKPNLYDIYPIITGKNLYNYNEAMYLITENANYQEMTNGYVLTPTSTTNEAVLKIGYPNRLVAGNTYGISYLYEGNIGGLKLYTTIKGLSQVTSEIEINDGKFVAPEGVYDLQLEFSVDNSSLNNSVEVYNIQIENNKVSEYETYEENKNMLVLDESLRGIGDYRDLACLESPNLLNPESQSAIVKGSATYYLSQTGNISYTINYLNEDNNVISSVSLTSGILTTPENCVKIVIPNITKEIILTNRLQINIGNTALIYYPYINEPSIIRQTFRYIFTGDENPYRTTVSSNTIFIFELFKDQLYKSNAINTVYCNYFLGIKDNEWQSTVQTRNDLIWGDGNGFINLIHSGFNSVAELKTKFAELNNLNTPVEVIGILNEPIVEPLSQENINALQGLKTYTPISNVFTNNDSLGYLDFEYIKSYENQRTDNAYILLKCWNMNNKMPYVIHSNYIDIPEDIDKVFIWLRRKDNLFDLTIQNLYDYNEGDPSSDKTKPTVVLTIHEDQITNNSIPCTATCVDDYGLRTIRFSKNNGASWDKIINVDQLNVIEDYTFENLTSNTQYTIRAEAVDLAGNIGGMSVITKTK